MFPPCPCQPKTSGAGSVFAFSGRVDQHFARDAIDGEFVTLERFLLDATGRRQQQQDEEEGSGSFMAGRGEGNVRGIGEDDSKRAREGLTFRTVRSCKRRSGCCA